MAGWTEALALNWWPVPTICVAIAILLLEVASAVDKELGHDVTRWYVFGGGPPSARSVLSVIASSTLTFAGLVFSVTMVVLQLASAQFSPMVIRTSYVRSSMEEIRQSGHDSTRVLAELRNVAENIAHIAPPHRRAELERQIRKADAALARLQLASDPPAATFR